MFRIIVTNGAVTPAWCLWAMVHWQTLLWLD